MTDAILLEKGILQIEGTNRKFYPHKLLYRQGVINNGIDGKFYLGNTAYEFKSGYCIICNILPTGLITTNPNQTTSINPAYLNPANFLVYPVGNGGYYIWSSIYNKELNTNYYKNDLGAFSNKTIFNISNFNLRYINKGQYTNWPEETKTINFIDSYIIDIVGNQWNGPILKNNAYVATIQDYLTIDEEEFFSDKIYETDTYIDQATLIRKSVYAIKEKETLTFNNLNIKIL